MHTNVSRWSVLLGATGLMLVAATALADGPLVGHFEGGRGAAPAHFGGGPARAAAPHFGGGARFGGGPARGYAAPHYQAAPRYQAAPHYQPAPHYGFVPRHDGGAAAHYAPGPGGRVVRADHGNWNRTGGDGHWNGDQRWEGDQRWGGDGDGGWDRDRYWVGADWGGGDWDGGYWPGVSYGVNFAWFLPVLPGVYATYWYGGVPYYYADDAYYTWDPSYDGYVATDPPPVAGSAAPAPASSDRIFMYPEHGQSPAQQAKDRRACEQWAANQVGNSYNSADYRRAMTACAEGRGYTVR
ncbi:MAG: hypothetical protein HKM03_10390 [Steroidobacteraceae bacterium]|nr:hypothetical protein [Steroidobacteraceae bacterium]